MKLSLKIKGTETSLKVDLISEVSVPTPNLYLLTYKFDTYRYIMKLGSQQDIRTENYSEFHLTRLDHIIYGYFYYKGQKIGAQIGAYVRRVGMTGFVNVVLSHDFCDYTFENEISEIIFDDEVNLMIIDIEDFNMTRKLIGQSEYSLTEYLAKKLSQEIADDNGLTLNEETSLFSVFVDKFDPLNFMTSNGMTIYLEEQAKNK
jgi:hypothetical protein